MPKTNVFSWTSMIDGYGKNGNPSEALELFGSMTKECHIVPNHVSFLGSLSACAHVGFVSKGREIFDSIEREYSMKPTMENYACLVDLLGRTGNLNQSLEFVTQMPERPNSDVWEALLSSCRLHGDVDLAKIAANGIFKLSSNNLPGAYAALSNTLAEAGSWNGVSHLRELMKARGISKDTCFTWIGSNTSLEAFHARKQMIT